MRKVVIVGAGFYGCHLAKSLSKLGYEVTILEENAEPLQRASYGNQARIHNGYHYPRSIKTAASSRVNFSKFVDAYPDAVVNDFEKVYAISKVQSKVTAMQFVKFCSAIGAPIRVADDKKKSIFNKWMVDEVFAVKEFAFDAEVLKSLVVADLFREGVKIVYNAKVLRINADGVWGKKIVTYLQDSSKTVIEADIVLICAYSSTNFIARQSGARAIALKHELAELCLVNEPEIDCAVTIMDGPFFSTMPFPPRKLWSFTHVKYTPHCQIFDDCDNVLSEANILALKTNPETRFEFMKRDAARFIPALMKLELIDTIFEVKTLLQKNETDDGRPIHFQKFNNMENCFSILGGKIDNVFDIETALLAVLRNER